jgi:hypothetical protein
MPEMKSQKRIGGERGIMDERDIEGCGSMLIADWGTWQGHEEHE